MNIVHINSDHGNTIYKNLVDELYKYNISQRVFKFVRPNNLPKIQYDEYVDIRLNYNNIDRYFFHIKHNKVTTDFMNYTQDKEIDLIHAHTLFSNGYIAYQAFRKNSIPYIVAVRSTDINVFFKYMPHLRRIGLNILLNAKKIIFISSSHKDLVLQRYIPTKYLENVINKSVVIPNGIDKFFFENKNFPKTIDQKQELIVLTTAWINKNKNQLNVCKAIEILNTKGFNIRYKIVGGTENSNTYKDLMEKIRSYPFVEILARKNNIDLLKEYRKADIFAMVSFKETFGLSYIESLLQCTPVIYTEKQGIDGYFEEGRVGYSAKPESPVDIAKKIELVICNYNYLSENSIKEIKQFKWEEISLQYKIIYESIIKEQ